MRYHVVRTLFITLFFLGFGNVHAQGNKVPESNGTHVNDFAGVLDAGQEQELEQMLLAYEDSTSNQIAIVTEKSAHRQNIDKVMRAVTIGREWGVGQKGKNNGVVFYLIMDEDLKHGDYHIATANATQGRLTDGIVGQIGRDYLIPSLKQDPPDYYSGIRNSTLAITQALAGEFKADPKKTGKEEMPGWGVMLVVVGIIILLAFFNNKGGGDRGLRSGGAYWLPLALLSGGRGGGGWGGGGSSGGGGGWGGFGGGGGFDGGGAGGSW